MEGPLTVEVLCAVVTRAFWQGPQVAIGPRGHRNVRTIHSVVLEVLDTISTQGVAEIVMDASRTAKESSLSASTRQDLGMSETLDEALDGVLCQLVRDKLCENQDVATEESLRQELHGLLT